MFLTVTYSEIQDLIKQKSQKNIRLSAIDSRTVIVSTDIVLPMVGAKEIKVQLILNEINNDYALLSYSNGLGVDFIITAFLKYIETQTDISYFQSLPNNRIKIQLLQIPKLEEILDKIVIQGLSFTSDSAVLKFWKK